VGENPLNGSVLPLALLYVKIKYIIDEGEEIVYSHMKV
jgi:hypothetical protein